VSQLLTPTQPRQPTEPSGLGPPEPPRRRGPLAWFRSHWLAIVAAVVLFGVGIGIGAAPSGTEEAAQPVTVTEATTVTEQATVTQTETVNPTDEERAALQDEQARLDQRQARLDERAATLKARDRALDKRERQISAQEQAAERSTFGDGTYLVGTDIPAGSYLAPGGDMCYWERATPGGGIDNIIENYIGSGQVRATTYDGELFNTQGCGEWRPG
jgi:hypothetical protein